MAAAALLGSRGVAAADGDWKKRVAAAGSL